MFSRRRGKGSGGKLGFFGVLEEKSVEGKKGGFMGGGLGVGIKGKRGRKFLDYF